jgi:hypothetical protein
VLGEEQAGQRTDDLGRLVQDLVHEDGTRLLFLSLLLDVRDDLAHGYDLSLKTMPAFCILRTRP